VNPMYRRTIRLGPVDAALRTDEPAVLDYLSDFYTITDRPVDSNAWIVDARVGSAVEMQRNSWGVRYRADRAGRILFLRADSSLELAMSARKALRETLVEHCEAHRYVMLHASAFADDHRVVLVLGDKGSGKTTLALKATLDGGFRYVSNDHLILYAETGSAEKSDRLAITSLPTPIPLKVGTYLDLEDRLPMPWDNENLDVDAFRAMPITERYRHDRRLLYTYRRLRQENPVRVPLGPADGGPKVAVVLARYTEPGHPVDPPRPVADPVAALWPHVRFDWVFDPALNTQHLPRTQRDRDAYAADAQRLLAALVDRATVVSWEHGGDPQPLLDHLGAIS
jgi:hypothetical protein